MADGRTGQALVVCEVLEGSDAEQASQIINQTFNFSNSFKVLVAGQDET